uniref:Uncharacterized protein n=1 Tax=Glossina palpalis gambiensis TaxID=67801 RepID=A0A1B0B9J2_9MUSC
MALIKKLCKAKKEDPPNERWLVPLLESALAMTSFTLMSNHNYLYESGAYNCLVVLDAHKEERLIQSIYRIPIICACVVFNIFNNSSVYYLG